MGGKTGTTTQSVQIPKEVLARYNAVNTRAEQVARQPFQPYQGQFVAGLTPTQQAGVQATNQYAQTAQPYFSTATQQLGQAQGQGQEALRAAFGSLGQGVQTGQEYAGAATRGIGAALQGAQPYQAGATTAAVAGAQGIDPNALQIQQYMNPYTQAVAQTTQQALQQQQQEQMAGQLGNAIRSGAFGGDRAALAAANLGRQQQLGMAQAMAPIYQQGYSQALQTAQQQQGVELSAAQANRAALQNLAQQLQGIGQQGYGQQMGAAQQIAALGQQQYGQGLGAAQQLGALGQQQYGMGAGTAQQLAALGTGAQQAALQGAQAQLGAGTLEQQTQQADLTARYQQFLQERGYPFQVAQFLANIAMGTGALSGQTTTTTQPMPFFSDRRVKDDVKEIGKTHDGQPIYSFKYKGDDATRIGLMAQDVEKKHPEAVYDMGGVKGVDYKQATKGAEREERYEGGLVPASMGGAVTQPGAYGRGGYYDGGAVDPNDIQALLQQQQQAFGPFGEGGIYGASQHETPFSGAKGVVPTTRMHVPKLMRPDTPPRLPEGLGSQAINAFDQAMGMKKRYDEAKQMLAGEDTPQEKMDKQRPNLTTKDEVKNLAGPDIKAPSSGEEEKGLFGTLASMFGYAEGGSVHRGHYALGGSKDPALPYEEDDKSPYKYFPTEILETEKAELQKPSQAPAPTSQTGIGLGTVLGFFLKDGGAVPRGHLQTGGVYDPTMGRVVSTDMSPLEELNKEDIYSRELQPAAAPRFRVFERLAREEGAKGVKPTELYRTPERSAMLDLTMPEGAPRAKPYQSGHNYGLAVDYSNTTPENYDAIRKAAAATGLTSGLDFKNPDAPHVQLGKGGYGGLYGEDVAINEGFGGRSQSGVVPPEAQEAAYAAARKVVGSRGVDPDSPRGKEMASGVMGFLKENQGWLVPFGAGLRGMVQSKSPFLAGALLEGVGTGLESVGAAQKQIADIALTQAQKEEAMGRIPRATEVEGLGFFLVRQPDGNYAWVRRSEYKPSMGARVEPSMVPANQIPPPPVGEGAKQAGEKVTSPEVKAPQIVTSNQVAQLTPEAVTSLNQEIEATKNLNPKEKTDYVQPAISEGSAATKLSYDINTYGGALSMIPEDSMIAGSALAPLAIEGKKAIDKILDQFGLKDYVYDAVQPDLTGINFAEEVAKIKSALSTSRTGEAGQRAVSAIDKFGEMFPDITTSYQGRRDNIASILVRNQQDIERGIFAEQWRNETAKTNPGYANKFSDNMNREFERSTQDQFRMDKETLKKMFETKMPNGQTWLYYMSTLKQPLTAEQIDFINQKFQNPAIFRYFPNIKVQ